MANALQKFKEKAKAASSRAASVSKRAGLAIKAANQKHNAKLREVTQQSRTHTLVSTIGSVGTAVVAGQVHRELAVKRGRDMLAKGINYGVGVAGAVASIYAKNPMVRTAGASFVGMAIAQVTIDTMNIDLVPGYNGEQAPA